MRFQGTSRPKAFRPRADRRGISEVVGSVLLLVITVAAFAVLFLMVQGIPKPAPGVSSDFEASMAFTGPTTAEVELRHIGGSTLEDGTAAVVLTVGNNTTTYSITDGVIGPGDALVVGGTWRLTVPLPVTNNTRVTVSVVSYVSNELLFQATLQAGNQGGAGGHSPIITAAWASSQVGSPSVYNNGLQTYRIHAIVVDVDGDLAETDPVTAKITVVPSGSLLSTNALGSGSFALVRTQDSYYQTADLVMGASVFPGNYNLEVTAVDGESLEATALVPLEVVNGNLGGGPTLTVAGLSTAPAAVETNDQDVSVLRLDLSSVGETTSLSQVLVEKTGQLPDAQVTVSLWLDADASGTFDAGADTQLTPDTAFTAGVANIFSAPILGIGVSSPQAVFVVAGFTGADDGTNVTFSIAEGADIRGTGVPSGATSSTDGTFPVSSTEVVVGSRLQAEPASGAPERILQNAAAVRMLGLSMRAAGEDFAWGGLNLTLLGSIPRSAVQVYVTVGGTVASGTASFNAARVATLPLAGTLPEASGWVSL
jgi:flagellin-like protein